MIDKILQDNDLTQETFTLTYAELTNFAHQVIGEAILATLSAPIKHLQVTTYDQHLVEATQLSIVDAIRNHFK